MSGALDLDVEQQYLLCRIQERRPDKHGTINALVLPLYMANPQSATWDYRLLDDEMLIVFGARGLIIWFGAPAEAEDGSLWMLQVRQTRTPGKGGEGINVGGFANNIGGESIEYEEGSITPYKFRVVDGHDGQPCEVFEVIELWDEDTDPDYPRQLISDLGLQLKYKPTPKVYIQAQRNAWVGPIPLCLNDANNLWFISAEVASQPLPLLQAPDSACICTIQIDISGHGELSKRCVIGPRVGQLRQIGRVDWASNTEVLARILKSIRKLDRGYAQHLELTDRMVDEVAAKLDPEPIPELRLHAQRITRAASILGLLRQNRDLSEKFLNQLCKVPSIQTAMTQARDKVIQDGREAIEAERERAKQEILAERERAKKELDATRNASMEKLAQEKAKETAHIESLRAERGILEQRVKQAKVAIASQVDNLDKVLGDRLAKLASAPEKAIADSLLIRAILQADAKPRSGRQPVAPMPQNISRLTQPDALRDALSRAFTARGLPQSAVRPIHAALLSGNMPILAGDGALSALEAYAECITAGSVLWLPIAPGIIEPGDLLGRADASTGHFRPHPGGLLDLLLQAEKTDDLYLVVLDGINRAAMEMYLQPILSCYAERLPFGRGRRALPLIHSCSVAGNDPYSDVSHVIWPDNVLLAGTLVDGWTTMQVPPSLWCHALFINMDGFDDERAVEVDMLEDQKTMAVSFRIWREWTKQISALSSVVSRQLRLVQDLPGVSSGYRHKRDALFTAASEYLCRDKKIALEDLMIHSWVPAAISTSHADAIMGFAAQNDNIHLRRAVELTEQALLPGGTTHNISSGM